MPLLEVTKIKNPRSNKTFRISRVLGSVYKFSVLTKINGQKIHDILPNREQYQDY